LCGTGLVFSRDKKDELADFLDIGLVWGSERYKKKRSHSSRPGLSGSTKGKCLQEVCPGDPKTETLFQGLKDKIVGSPIARLPKTDQKTAITTTRV
jgi:hypothetical protein